VQILRRTLGAWHEPVSCFFVVPTVRLEQTLTVMSFWKDGKNTLSELPSIPASVMAPGTQ